MKNFTGAKRGAGVLQWLVNNMPPHDLFIDAFLGTGAVTLGKAPAAATIGIDADAAAPGLWACQTVPEFTGVIGDARHYLASMLGVLDGGGPSAELPVRDLPGVFAGERSGHCLSGISADRICIYLDPPYLGSVRRGPQRRYYRCELLTQDEHAELLGLALGLAGHGCKVMISGYDSALYQHLLTDWRVDTFDTMTRRGLATEYLWCNFERPSVLHDARFVGANYRARQDLKRKRESWTRKLQAMTPQERQFIREALSQIN